MRQINIVSICDAVADEALRKGIRDVEVYKEINNQRYNPGVPEKLRLERLKQISRRLKIEWKW